MDMLVRLYDLPPLAPVVEHMAAQGVTIRRGIAPEKHVVLEWVARHFSAFWQSEADVAYARVPVSIWLAVAERRLLGFGCYDTTRRGFFGPTGVAESERGRGLGKALLLACLHDMWAQGYGYGIIGGVGPVAFYEKAVNAFVIPASSPGVYGGMLRHVDGKGED